MSNTTQDHIDSMVAYGSVVTVRHVPTRQCSQIIIEIPEEYHPAATAMLFGRSAFVLAATGETASPYGVVPLNEMSKQPDAHEASARPAANAPAPARQQYATHRIGGGLRVDVDPSRWLGIECQNAAFMFWLNAASASDAAEKARAICGVASRKDIASNPAAMGRFMEKIYHPYRRHQQQMSASTQGLRS